VQTNTAENESEAEHHFGSISKRTKQNTHLEFEYVELFEERNRIDLDSFDLKSLNVLWTSKTAHR
jgi:hypothetical protein